MYPTEKQIQNKETLDQELTMKPINFQKGT